ncbi:MAG: SOS response-associated peptidase [Micromonosporaceae bacterium]
MCGRYASTKSATDLATIFEASDETGQESLVASYNVAPTDPVHVVRRSHGGDRREVATARWGLLPPWARSPREGARMINARAETVATSRAFRVPFARRRCLVPADGWYEWLRQSEGRNAAKQPYFLTPKDSGVLAFAGLWQVWGPERLVTTTVITTAAVGDLSTVHDRMPLALPPDRWSAWLDAADAAPLLSSPGEDWAAGIELRPVGSAVGDVRNNSDALIRPVTASALRVDHADPVDLTLF